MYRSSSRDNQARIDIDQNSKHPIGIAVIDPVYGNLQESVIIDAN
jgi:predicted transcriptional regulator